MDQHARKVLPSATRCCAGGSWPGFHHRTGRILCL